MATSFVTTVEIKDASDTTVNETYTETYGTLAEQMRTIFIDSMGISHMRGMGELSGSILVEDAASENVNIGDVFKVKHNGTTVWIGYITGKSISYESSSVYSDRINITATSEIVRAARSDYLLLESSDSSADNTVTTTIQKILTDVFDGSEHSGKFQDNNVPIVDNGNITYLEANNTLPSLSIDVEYNEGTTPYTAVIEMVDTANGTINQSTVEKYITYGDTSNAWHTKQRSTSLLATFDIGAISTENNFIVDSDDLQGRLEAFDTDETGIVNRLVIDRTEVTTGTYSSEVTASRNAYGTKTLTIPDSNIGMSQQQKWLDGWLYWTLRPLSGYTFEWKMETYGYNPIFFSPDGYIKLTKDSGAATYAQLPLLNATYSLSSAGWSCRGAIGEARPVIDSRRLIVKQSQNTVTTDTTPPTVRFLDHAPAIEEKTYTKKISPMYIAAYAEDDTSVSSVAFQLSKWTGSAWSAWSSIGTGTFVANAESTEGYWEYDTASGYYDLVSAGGLSANDIFRIKSLATDPAGNQGEAITEYQYDADVPSIDVSIAVGTTASVFSAPTVFDVYDKFDLEVVLEDGSIDTVTVNYSGDTSTYTAAKTVSSGRTYWAIADIAVPDKGVYKIIEITATNVYGKITKATRYIRGIARPRGEGMGMSVIDPDTAADNTTTTATQYNDEIKFTGKFNNQFYSLALADVKLNLYDTSDVKQKQYTSSSTPAVVETSPTGSGLFSLTTDKATLIADGVTAGIWTAEWEITRKESFIDNAGVTQTDPSPAAEFGNRVQFELVPDAVGTWRKVVTDLETGAVATNTTGVADHTTRIPAAEKESNLSYDSGAKKAQIKFYTNIVDTPPDFGAAGWFGTNDTLVGSPVWYRLSSSNISGVNTATFTINQDDSTETYTYLVFKNGGTNQGAIRFDDATPKIQMTTNYQDGSPTWTDIATGTSNAINDTYATDVYELKVNSTDGSMTFTQDPSGTPTTLLTVASDGQITVTGDILPGTANTHSLGSTSNTFKDAHFGGTVYVDDLNGATDNWRIEWDVTNNMAIPHNIAIGFKDD